METLSYLFYITNLSFPLTPNTPPTCAEGKQKKKKTYIPVLFLGEESKEYWIMIKHVLFVILQSSVDMTDQPIHYYC